MSVTKLQVCFCHLSCFRLLELTSKAQMFNRPLQWDAGMQCWNDALTWSFSVLEPSMTSARTDFLIAPLDWVNATENGCGWDTDRFWLKWEWGDATNLMSQNLPQLLFQPYHCCQILIILRTVSRLWQACYMTPWRPFILEGELSKIHCLPKLIQKKSNIFLINFNELDI